MESTKNITSNEAEMLINKKINELGELLQALKSKAPDRTRRIVNKLASLKAEV